MPEAILMKPQRTSLMMVRWVQVDVLHFVGSVARLMLVFQKASDRYDDFVPYCSIALT